MSYRERVNESWTATTTTTKQRKPWKQKSQFHTKKIERKNLKYCQYLSFSDKNEEDAI